MVSQLEIDFRASAGGHTQNDRLREIFLSQPGTWLDMVSLGRQIGAWAVHSRVADLRKRWGMTILCRTHLDPSTHRRISSYYYEPDGGSPSTN